MSAASESSRTAVGAPPPEEWVGGYRRYDIVKEAVIALVVVSLLTIVLSAVFGSPDDQPLTIQRWATAAPQDFLVTATSELDGTSGVAGYGQPYNSTPDAAQSIFGLPLQKIAGVRIPINTAQDFVIGPLRTQAGDQPELAAAIRQWQSASPSQQSTWGDNYTKALDKATFSGGQVQVPAGEYGPVQPMMDALLLQARSGGLDGALLANKQFYQTDYTKALLFMSDSGYFEDLARAEHLGGDQWGMMNETGSYPGQAWLWLYTFWYQVPPWSNSGNADALVWAIMMLLTLALILVPFIPGVRAIPEKVKVHRLIWRDYYRRVEGGR